LDKKYKHDIEVVVDRLAVRTGIETRLADSFETALKLAEGLAYVDLADTTVAEAMAQAPSGRSAATSPKGGDSPLPESPPLGEVAAASAADGGGKLKGAGLPPNRI